MESHTALQSSNIFSDPPPLDASSPLSFSPLFTYLYTYARALCLSLLHLLFSGSSGSPCAREYIYVYTLRLLHISFPHSSPRPISSSLLFYPASLFLLVYSIRGYTCARVCVCIYTLSAFSACLFAFFARLLLIFSLPSLPLSFCVCIFALSILRFGARTPLGLISFSALLSSRFLLLRHLRSIEAL